MTTFEMYLVAGIVISVINIGLAIWGILVQKKQQERLYSIAKNTQKIEPPATIKPFLYTDRVLTSFYDTINKNALITSSENLLIFNKETQEIYMNNNDYSLIHIRKDLAQKTLKDLIDRNLIKETETYADYSYDVRAIDRSVFGDKLKFYQLTDLGFCYLKSNRFI